MKRIYHPWHAWECYPAGFYENRPKGRNLSEGLCKYMYAQFLRDIPGILRLLKGYRMNAGDYCHRMAERIEER